MHSADLLFRYDLILLNIRRRRRLEEEQRRQRRLWIHPITAARSTSGVYSTLFEELRGHPGKFFDYLRMSKGSFEELLQRVSGSIQRQDTMCRQSISPEERLIVTLRYLATGESFASLHFQFRLGKSTISYIVRDTCKALWDNLQADFLPHPTQEQWIRIADKFWDVAQFPNCVGAVDGKHIRIQKPAKTGSEYFNYKKYFSTILMAIADAQYRFVAVDIGSYGRTNDSRVFKNSTMGMRLYAGDFGLPEARPFPGTDGPVMPFVVVGDEAFQMCGNLLKPYSSRGLNYSQRIYNYRLTRARRFVECTFGIFASRWRIFTRPIQLSPTAVDDVVKAAVVLHNFVLTKEPLPMEQQDMESSLPGLEDCPRRTTAAIMEMRDQFAYFFLSDVGRVSWQDDMI